MLIARIRRLLSQPQPVPTMTPVSATEAVGDLELGSDRFLVLTKFATELTIELYLIVDETKLREPVLVVDGTIADFDGSLRRAIKALKARHRRNAEDWHEWLRIQVIEDARTESDDATAEAEDSWDGFDDPSADQCDYSDPEDRRTAAQRLLSSSFRYEVVYPHKGRAVAFFERPLEEHPHQEPIADGYNNGEETDLTVWLPGVGAVIFRDRDAWPLWQLGSLVSARREEPARQ